MSIAAVTMVWNDAFFLRKWVAYYGPLLGARNLYVVSHGQNDYIRDIPGEFNVIQVPRDAGDIYFDRRRWGLLSHITSGLTRYHKAVICTDVDEILLPTKPGGSLTDIVENLAPDAHYLVPGFEVFPGSAQALLDPAKPVGNSVGCLLYSPFYSKAAIAQKDIEFYPGGHGIANEPFNVTQDLMLLHLKYLNTAELERRNSLRLKLANSDEMTADTGEKHWRPLKVWKNLDKTTQQAFQKLDTSADMDWEPFFTKACTDLDRLKGKRKGVYLIANKKTDPVRAELPDWARVLF
ncbi:hypothetical protein [Aestuariivita boseongensis]|uniref:hypothetical protein n=1 Tax=Aestuariivita boseongensis TaxID=1470562 RepID=UPI000681A5AA|nr:hypothetical protein [Aestuariivita boseongensis]